MADPVLQILLVGCLPAHLRGMSPAYFERVDSEGSMAAALRLGRWHAVVAWEAADALRWERALELVRCADRELPFVLLTGRDFGSPARAEALAAGVHACAVADDPAAIALAIRSQVLEAEKRRSRRRSPDAMDETDRLNRMHIVLSGIRALVFRVRNRDDLLREACRVAVEAGGLRMAWLGTYDPQALSVKPVAWHGEESGFLGLMALRMLEPVPEGRGLVRRAMREKRPVIIEDIEQDSLFRLRAEALARGYRSAAVLPLLIDNDLTGVLGLFADEPRFFDDDEMRLLAELANDIALALDYVAKRDRLHYLACYDPVTGLANRALFLEHVEQECQAALHGGTKLGLVAVDIERFKTINDTFGRHAGDALLKQIAARMRGRSRETSRFARMGADRFAVLVPGIRGAEDLGRLIEQRLVEVFGPLYSVGASELTINAKVGAAIFPTDGTDAETLFKNAEAALKKAKASGERYLFHQREMTAKVGEHLRLENRLRRALEREEFVLHYQPKVHLKSGGIVGLEALIRWQTEEGQLVPPAQFIPLMEETGLILEAGAWALSAAVRDHAALTRKGVVAPRIAVNVSAAQLRKRDFVEVVRAAVAEGISPPGIELEVTESMLMEDMSRSIRKLNEIRELGIDIAIDDFGTGYSSLAYLARLPVSKLKIDRSFVGAMLGDPNAMTLVGTMVSLAHSLKLGVVAEGVESEAQAKVLRDLNCDEMQGYLFSKPLSLEDIAKLLADNAVSWRSGFFARRPWRLAARGMPSLG